MSIFDNLLDTASNAMKSFVGESERERLIEECKRAIANYEEQLDHSRELVNIQVHKYNDIIPLINQRRRSDFKPILEELHTFLKRLGNIGDPQWRFAFELTTAEQLGFKDERKLTDYRDHVKSFEKTENQIYDDAVKGVIVGLKLENKKQNIKIEQLKNTISFAAMNMQKQYETVATGWSDRTEIANIYLNCIELICETISAKILPELELVSAFLRAESVKNNVIADLPIEDARPTDISLIKGTIYGKHYTFVKNAFLFYILSKEIYESPILTRLTQGELLDNDYQNDKNLLSQQKDVLERQAIALNVSSVR